MPPRDCSQSLVGTYRAMDSQALAAELAAYMLCTTILYYCVRARGFLPGEGDEGGELGSV